MLETLSNGWIALEDFRTRWGEIADIFLIVLAVVVINLILRLAFRQLAKRVEHTRSVWDDAIYESLSGPLRGAVWVGGLSLAATIGSPEPDSIIGTWLPDVRVVAYAGIVIWFVLSLITAVEKNMLVHAARRGDPLDETTADAIAKLLRLAAMITGALVVLQTLGVSISGLLAFGGVGGIAIGFAAKDVIANLLGGLTIYLNRPFSVGDWIRSPDRDIEGVVEAVGWRATSVRRFDKRALYVPNAAFTTISLENPSRMTHRQINETVGLRYEDSALVGPVVSDIREMIESHPDIDTSQTILVYFNRFAPSSLELFIYCFTVTTGWGDFLAVKQDVLTRCHDIISGHGAEVAFPTTTVHLARNDDDDADGKMARGRPGTGAPKNPEQQGSTDDDA
ncbi:MAG: mechanosensitive ion channel family protein [Salinisphaeraceae bacterium]